MQPLERLWFCLESIPGLCVVRSEWEGRLGHELPAAEPFLRPTDRVARSYPCPDPGGEGCPRRVLVHGPGDIEAACQDSPRRCDRLRLTEGDIVLYRFDVEAFCRELARLLEIEPRFEPVAGGVQTWAVGVRSPARGEDFLVYLTIPLTPEDLRQAASRLVATNPDRFLLLAPSEENRDLTTRDLLRRHDARFGTLKAMVTINDEHSLVAMRPVWEVFDGLESRPRDDEANLFQRRGEGWTIRYDRREVHLANLKGVRYLAALVREPGREFSPAELEVAAGEVPVTGPQSVRTRLLGVDLPSDGLDPAGDVLDDRAIVEYQSSLAELESEIEEADANHDLARAERLRKEEQVIQDELLAARGLHGRTRSLQDPLKATRDRVRNAVDRALDRVRTQHPALGEHLDAFLTRGTHWSYRPNPPVDWIV